MDNEQIAEELRELSDRLDTLENALEEVYHDPKHVKTRQYDRFPPQAATRLAHQERLLQQHGHELAVLPGLFERITSRLILLEKGWE